MLSPDALAVVRIALTSAVAWRDGSCTLLQDNSVKDGKLLLDEQSSASNFCSVGSRAIDPYLNDEGPLPDCFFSQGFLSLICVPS